MKIGISLAMSVGDDIQRNPVRAEGDIGAVIRIEATQHVFIGFAAARMLGDEEARHGSQNITRIDLGRDGLDLESANFTAGSFDRRAGRFNRTRGTGQR